MILPVFVSVHSIVSWDFAVQIAVEGWNATIFAPYFAIGAVHSGVAGVILTQVLPFADPRVLGVFDAFERAVYALVAEVV